MIDVTERKRAEREYTDALQFIEKTSKLASIGVMAAGINHEINQPLTAIKFHVDGLLYWEKHNKGIIPEMIIDSLRDISDGIRRIDEIIKHMRSFWVSSERSSKQLFDINETVCQAMSLLDRQINSHQIETELILSDSVRRIHGFRVHVEQIIINLVVNAMHALDEIDCKDKKITIETGIDDSFVILRIIDNGPGMDFDIGDKIFDPFYSKRKLHEGMGMGLAIVKFFTDEHDGSIAIERNQPSGSKVTVRFPTHHLPDDLSDEDSHC